MTRAPTAFATWTTAVPGPAAGAVRQDHLAGLQAATDLQRDDRRLVVEDPPAPCWWVIVSGRRTSEEGSTRRRSAAAPEVIPATRSPAVKPESAGASSTSPLNSCPTTYGGAERSWYSPRLRTVFRG